MKIASKLKSYYIKILVKIYEHISQLLSAEVMWNRYAKNWKPSSDASILGEEWKNWELFKEITESNLKKDMRVLEIGCGGGKLSLYAAPLCKELWCVDVSREMLKMAQENNAPLYKC